MFRVLASLQKLSRDEEGAALIEYTVLLGVLLVAVILTITAVGGWIGGRWTSLCTALANAAGTCDAAAGKGS